MGGVYSERFLRAAGASTLSGYLVPAGKRAVVRSLVLASSTGGGGLIQLYLGGSFTWMRSLTGPNLGESIDMRQVVYAGERIEVYTTTAHVYAAVSGYLFDDGGGSSGFQQVGQVVGMPIEQTEDVEVVNGSGAL